MKLDTTKSLYQRIDEYLDKVQFSGWRMLMGQFGALMLGWGLRGIFHG